MKFPLIIVCSLYIIKLVSSLIHNYFAVLCHPIDLIWLDCHDISHDLPSAMWLEDWQDHCTNGRMLPKTSQRTSGNCFGSHEKGQETHVMWYVMNNFSAPKSGRISDDDLWRPRTPGQLWRGRASQWWITPLPCNSRRRGAVWYSWWVGIVGQFDTWKSYAMNVNIYQTKICRASRIGNILAMYVYIYTILFKYIYIYASKSVCLCVYIYIYLCTCDIYMCVFCLCMYNYVCKQSSGSR